MGSGCTSMSNAVTSMADAPKDNGPTPMMLVLNIAVCCGEVLSFVGQDPTPQVKESLQKALLPGIEKRTKGLVKKNGNKALEFRWGRDNNLEAVAHILVDSNKLIEQSRGAGTTTNLAINVLDLMHQKDKMVAEEIQKAVGETVGNDLGSKSAGWVTLNSCKVLEHDPTRPRPQENHHDKKEDHHHGHKEKKDHHEHHGHKEKKEHHHEHHKRHSK